MSESEWTKILGWPGYRVYRSEINEAAKTLRLWVRPSAGTANWSVPGAVEGSRKLPRSTSGRYGICRGRNISKRLEEAVGQAWESAAVRRVARQFGLAVTTVRADRLAVSAALGAGATPPRVAAGGSG
jgi:hypothetical protein